MYIVRRIISDDHNYDHAPETLTLLCTKDYGNTWEEIDTWSGLDFGANISYTFNLDTIKSFNGVRLRVDNVRNGDGTQIGYFIVYGRLPEPI